MVLMNDNNCDVDNDNSVGTITIKKSKKDIDNSNGTNDIKKNKIDNNNNNNNDIKAYIHLQKYEYILLGLYKYETVLQLEVQDLDVNDKQLWCLTEDNRIFNKFYGTYLKTTDGKPGQKVYLEQPSTWGVSVDYWELSRTVTATTTNRTSTITFFVIDVDTDIDLDLDLDLAIIKASCCRIIIFFIGENTISIDKNPTLCLEIVKDEAGKMFVIGIGIGIVLVLVVILVLILHISIA
eukprot:Awhi_evm1s6561